MNCRDRRANWAAWRNTVDQVAALCARAVMDLGTGGDGQHRRVDEPLAIRALERGFSHVLRHGGEPHVMRLTEEEALALAPWIPPPKGWPSFMAVGLNRLGRASYISRPIRVDGVSPTEAR